MRVEPQEFLAFAADVFGVQSESLTLETTYGSCAEWDSMAQLRLVTGIAERFHVEIPFADVVTVTSLWEFLRRINGDPLKKVVAVDLDNTLWHGVVGEDGAEAIRPNAALQRELKELVSRGVLLVALSKNNEEDAFAGLDRLDILTRDDFVAFRFNWKPKAENLADVAAELNLGVESFVFVDDNPVERLEMSARLPEVSVADFPPVLAAYFPERPLTEEDRRKTEEYRAEAKRKECLAGLEPREIWAALGLELEVRPLEDGDVPRLAQLSQKANQFNVCTNRYSEDDIRRLATEGLVVTARTKDRYGDQGIVAYAIVREGEIVDWVMSCRVAGRGIEERFEAELERLAVVRGATALAATWRDSGRNAPVRDLFDRLGFSRVSESPDVRRYAKTLASSPCFDMTNFLDKMSAILETPVAAETRFRSVAGWSSLMGFGILVTLENDFGRRMTIDEFRQRETIADLAAACADRPAT